MAYYLLELADPVRTVKQTRAMLVEADSATEARQLAAAQDGGDLDWTDTDIATIVDVSTLSDADYAGWRYVVTIRDPDTGGEEGIVHQVEYTGVASDTVDLIGAALGAAFVGRNVDAAIADDGAVFTDETDEANEDTTGDVTLLPSTAAADDAYYFGSDDVFADLILVISQAMTGTNTITWEYYNGTAWATLTVAGTGADLKTGGAVPVTFTAPSDWAKTTINSQGPYYFVRLVTDGNHTQQPLGTRVHFSHKTTGSYSTPTLTAADATADGLGDQELTVDVYPPGADASIPSMVGTITHKGIAAADLTAVLDIPTAIPYLARRLKG